MFSFIPLPAKLAAIVMIMLGALGFGYMKGKEGAKIAIANYEAAAQKQINELKDINAEISSKVTVQYVDRVNTIREKETRYVDNAKDNVPSQFELSNGWVYTHDISTAGSDADPSRSSDETPSGIKDNEGLITILRNYSTCQQNAEQVKNLQQWITENQKAVEDSNKKAEPKKKKFGVF
jgi:hypothetical protein